MVDKLDKFHKTIFGYTLFAVIELAITYGFVSLAIDTGNLLWYLLTLVFLVGALQNFTKLVIRLLPHNTSRKNTR